VGSALLGVTFNQILFHIISYLHNVFPLLVRIGFCYTRIFMNTSYCIFKTKLTSHFSVHRLQALHFHNVVYNTMEYVLRLQRPEVGSSPIHPTW
jgi:hypothetical protein